MKKIFSALSFLLMAGIMAFANDEKKIDPKVIAAFQKEFSFAENAKWELKGELAQVNFSMNDQGFVAWYNDEAELLSTARNLLYMQLPLSVIRTLEQEYADADLSGFTEITRNGETYYRFQAERKNKKFEMKAMPSGNVTVVKRVK
jgi:hypothetical protein